MIGMLLAYDEAGNVIATLDYLVARDADGNVVGLVDFSAHEAAGGKLRDVWNVGGAAGSATWPEWIGGSAHDFRVLLEGGRIASLEHRASGHRRERAAVERAIERRIEKAHGEPADIRDLVGGPERALILTRTGRNARKVKHSAPDLPTVRLP